MSKDSRLILVSSLFLLTVISEAICCRMKLDAAHGSTNGTRMYRSEASGGLTVLLKQDDYVQFGFTVVSSVCDIVINNVAYSNDGRTDNVSIFVATESRNNILSLMYVDIGQFETLERFGHGELWNVIQNSGPIGRVTTVSTGRHILTLEAVSTDYYGVELDTIKLTFTCKTAGGSTTNECPEFELNTTDSPPGKGGGLSVGEILGTVVGIVGVVIAVPGTIAGCIAVVRRMRVRNSPKTAKNDPLLATHTI